MYIHICPQVTVLIAMLAHNLFKWREAAWPNGQVVSASELKSRGHRQVKTEIYWPVGQVDFNFFSALYDESCTVKRLHPT